jgi:transcriptional regulator with XRE-family HTH domain
MDSQRAVAIRAALGLTQDQLAAELSLTPNVVAAWEAGAIAIPQSIAQELDWRGAAAERQAALASSGLAQCDWFLRWDSEPVPQKLRAYNAHIERFVVHHKTCDVCLARDRYLAERFPPMPPRPQSGLARAIGKLGEWIGHLPRWAQPVAALGITLFVLGLIRALARLIR